MNRLQELDQQNDQRRKELAKIFATYPDLRLPTEVAQSLDTLNEEIQAADKEIVEYKRREDIRSATSSYLSDSEPGRGAGPQESKSSQRAGLPAGTTLGSFFMDHQLMKDWRAREMPNGNAPSGVHLASPAIEIPGFAAKDLLITGTAATSAGALITPQYLPLVSLPRRKLVLRDMITVIQTNSDSVEWPRITSYTNNAASVAEATGTGDGTGAKPQSGLALERENVSIRTIANWVALSRRSVADAPLITGIVNEFLLYNLQEELEDQIASGDAVGQNLDGIFHVSGTTAAAWDTDLFTTTRKALTKAQVVGRAERINAWLMNPYDLQAFDLLTNNEKNFYRGGPNADSSNQQLWGLPVVTSEAVPQGYAAVGDFRTVILLDREQAMLRMTDSHSDFFTRNLIAILAELRAGLAYSRPAAIVIVDLTA